MFWIKFLYKKPFSNFKLRNESNSSITDKKYKHASIQDISFQEYTQIKCLYWHFLLHKSSYVEQSNSQKILTSGLDFLKSLNEKMTIYYLKKKKYFLKSDTMKTSFLSSSKIFTETHTYFMTFNIIILKIFKIKPSSFYLS